MVKNKKIQYSGSNRHGQKLTNRDKKNMINAFNEKRLIFDAKTQEELEEILNNNNFEGKRLYGATRQALDYALQSKKIVKQIKTKDNE